MAIDNSQWGLTTTGFYAPSYDEILDSVEDFFIKNIGQDIVLTSNSNFGIMARMIARYTRAVWEQMQLTYYSSFISSATDASLDYIGGTMGLRRKVDTPSFAKIKITTTSEYLVQADEQFMTDDGYEFTLLNDVTTTLHNDDTWYGIGWVQCDQTGADTNVGANTITIETNPDENVVSVTNLEKAAGGEDYEDDMTYRQRLRDENAARPGSTEAGIRSAIMNVSGVRQVNIVDNPNQSTDEYGNLPNSVHIYVLGGIKEDIANTLADYVAAGAKLVGGEVVKTQDATGNWRNIAFDYAKEKKVYINLDISTDESWNTDSGVDDVKQSLADYINDLRMGDPVYITRLYSAVYDIEGISDATLKIGLDSQNLKDENITNQAFEVPVCDVDNIEVSVNGVRVD